MKKISAIFLLIIFLSGCATYKFHHGKQPYNKGYVVSREDYTILEYTLGKDDTVPNLSLARERFKRRRDIVEDYYKRMGYIENRFKMAFMDPAVYFLKLVGGIFRLPFIAISDLRAAHNAAYKEKLRKIEEEKDAREAARIKAFKEKLNTYIQRDLEKEALVVGKPISKTEETFVKETPVTKEPPAIVAEQPKPEEKQLAQEQAISAVEESRPKEKQVAQPPKIPKARLKTESAKNPGQPVAVIVANPVKGYSPLMVHFSGSKSYVPKGRIIAYSWDFGDGDTSTKPNPVNTYYSANFMPQDFTVNLTVQDDKGNTATATATIRALNK